MCVWVCVSLFVGLSVCGCKALFFLLFCLSVFVWLVGWLVGWLVVCLCVCLTVCLFFVLACFVLFVF